MLFFIMRTDNYLINEKVIKQIIISSHYEEKHSKHMTDEIVLAIVTQLDGRNFPIVDKKFNPKRGFFMLDDISLCLMIFPIRTKNTGWFDVFERKILI